MMLKCIGLLTLVVLLFACQKEEDCEEKIDSKCSCIALYDPVCGCNDKTYGNSCEANCAGITDFTPGECP